MHRPVIPSTLVSRDNEARRGYVEGVTDEPPKLSVASSNDDADLARQAAIDNLQWPTREMAANLLRVTRGAGKPWDLPQQIINLAESILKASKHSNAWGIWSEMEKVLQSGMPDDDDGLIGSEETIVRGSLQLVASRLVHQRTQAAAGGREIGTGIRMVEQEREENRKRWEKEQSALARKPKAARIAAAKALVAGRAENPDEDPPRGAPKPRSTADFMRLQRQQRLETDQ